MTYGLVAFVVLVVGACVWFTSQNMAPVPVIDLLVTRATQVPLSIVLFSSVLVGAAGTLAVLAWPLLRLRMLVRKQARQIGDLEQEIHGLRTLPLDEQTSEQHAQGG